MKVRDVLSNLFVNGPIQNGDFSFGERPHKLVGLRLASTLNALGENRSTVDLWNVARLAGDIEFQAHGGHPGPARLAYERDKVTRRYQEAGETREFLLDCDPAVITLSKTLVEGGLTKGVLRIQSDTGPVCLGCGHFVGTSPMCPSCSSKRIGTARTKRLFALRDPDVPIFTSNDMYGGIDAKYVADAAAHRPNPLAISTRRDLGVPLDEFGLHGQVLNPQASLFTAALAAGIAADAEKVTMLVTPCVGIKIAAYGQHFMDAGGCRLNYAFHGRIPYDDVFESYSPDRMEWTGEHLYRTWFLPLQSIKSREPISKQQIDPLRKFLRRIVNRRLAEPGETASDRPQEVSRQIRAGSYRWISDKQLLGAVLPLVAADAAHPAEAL